MIILWDPSPASLDRYRFALGAEAQQLEALPLVQRALTEDASVRQVVIGPDIALDTACALAESARVERPEVGIILLRQRLDVTTLSQALRSGVREVVPADDPTALADATRRSQELTSRLAGHQGGVQNEGKVITVFSAKGGVGKTTMSTNLATHLAMSGLRVLLIDLDLSFGDVAISMQLTPTRSINDAQAMAGHLDEAGLLSLVTPHTPSGLDVVCAPADPADGDRVPPAVTAELIRVAKSQYDFIIVDTPPSFTEHVLAACDVSSVLVLIATLDIPAVKNLRIALDTLDMLGSPRDSRVIVLNRSDTKVGLRAEDVESAIKSQIAVSVPSSLSVPASINRGVPIVLEDPKHPVSAAIRDLGDQHIRARFGADVPREAKRKSLFGSRR